MSEVNRNEDGGIEVDGEEILPPEIGTAVTVGKEMSGRGVPAVDSVGGMLRPVAAPEMVVKVQNETRALIAEALVESRDFGTIPGTSKPTLFKPGAERICAAFAVVPRFEIVEQEVDHEIELRWRKKWKDWNNGSFTWQVEEGTAWGLYRYVVRCTLHLRATGEIVGEGVGACSSLESKYCDRPRDVENTILKMGKKRAFIDATLTAFGLSDEFTQDVEDLKANGVIDADAPSRRTNGNSQGSSQGSGDPLDAKCFFKSAKAKGMTWRDLIDAGDTPKGEPGIGLVVWYLGKIEDGEMKPPREAGLLEALEKAVSGTGDDDDPSGGEAGPEGAPVDRAPSKSKHDAKKYPDLDAPLSTPFGEGPYEGMTIAQVLERDHMYVASALLDEEIHPMIVDVVDKATNEAADRAARAKADLEAKTGKPTPGATKKKAAKKSTRKRKATKSKAAKAAEENFGAEGDLPDEGD